MAPGAEVLPQDVRACLKEVTGQVPYYQPRDEYFMRLVMLRASGVKDIDFETLICLAGFGTSFGYHPKDYWVMYMPPDAPEVTEARIAGARGVSW